MTQHPDYEEEEAPEWLVDVPDPDSAPEWEMLSFYRFVDIDQPEAFANMLQVWYFAALCCWGPVFWATRCPVLCIRAIFARVCSLLVFCVVMNKAELVVLLLLRDMGDGYMS